MRALLKRVPNLYSELLFHEDEIMARRFQNNQRVKIQTTVDIHAFGNVKRIPVTLDGVVVRPATKEEIAYRYSQNMDIPDDFKVYLVEVTLPTIGYHCDNAPVSCLFFKADDMQPIDVLS